MDFQVSGAAVEGDGQFAYALRVNNLMAEIVALRDHRIDTVLFFDPLALLALGIVREESFDIVLLEIVP